jgi:sulfate/thiosulfate transport system substrate-binding protein
MVKYAPFSTRVNRGFPQLKLTTIEDFGGWTTAQATHFKDGGVFDQITAP